ncbi:DUF1501 domain-containing protein [Roseomonas marmotae]|uniref:DUF1501 domain-containing protein n=1 Tax=Roseomonas marmotae TaxID=2768161 RepID=A0ABS3KEB2_9PROT|nr:DUF1501 domain-containing protein [Roseomonas marmotae]MBO1075804.1 DUF1501 domain-containing protein [Roseomonas marmotae]QTI80526.1 DUF1501 domain-containing protein [Roseomonas marmotae]
MSHLPKIGRRGFLLGLSAFAASSGARLALANPPPGTLVTEARLVVVILRGAMDGMAALAPYGDASYRAIRGGLALPEPGQENGLLDCGGFFGLNPRLTSLHTMFREGSLLPVHAVAGPYRNRSHFEAQDMLESGALERGGLTSGWLNRALSGLPPRAPGQPDAGLAVGLALPLLMRGPQNVGMWAPPSTVLPPPDLYARMADLLHTDPVLGRAVTDGLRGRGFAAETLMDGSRPSGGFLALAGVAGKLLRSPDGPRVAAMELAGWDTHAAQTQRMGPVLGQLDAGLNALRAQLGEAWRNTAVLVMTEFGRTARVNGNNGTDHGTGGVAFVLGGAVAGGRVLADWPGLAENQLFEKRDLQPTRDLRAVAKGLLRYHLRLPPAAVAAAFPDSENVDAEKGLVDA